MANEFLQSILGDDLYTQVTERLTAQNISLANLSDGSHIPKAKFDEANGKVKTLTTQLAQITAQLDAAKAAQGDTGALNDKIAQLTAQLTAAQSKLTTQALEYKVRDALKAANARNVDIVLPLLKMDTIKVGKDGNLEGLTDQVEAIKKTDGYLFSDAPAYQGGFQGRTGDDHGGENVNAQMNAAFRQLTGRQ